MGYTAYVFRQTSPTCRVVLSIRAKEELRKLMLVIYEVELNICTKSLESLTMF